MNVAIQTCAGNTIYKILEIEIERQLLVHMSTLLNNEIHEIEFLFPEYSELVHLSTLFENILKGKRKKENMK